MRLELMPMPAEQPHEQQQAGKMDDHGQNDHDAGEKKISEHWSRPGAGGAHGTHPHRGEERVAMDQM